MAGLAALTDEIFAELKARTPDDERGAPWEHEGESYYSCTPAGRELGQLRRVRDERILLDLHEFGSDYAALGVEELNDGATLLAYAIDLNGSEIFTLRFRDLATGADLPLEITPAYYSGAWLGDTFFYTVPDHAHRPHEVWRVNVRTGERECILTEPDEHFHLAVERSRSGTYVVISATSRTTTQAWYVDAPDAKPVSLRDRVHGVEYAVEYDGARDRWLFLTNENETEFAVEGIAPTPGERLHEVLAYRDCLVTYQRSDGHGLVRIIEPDGTPRFEMGPDEPGGSIALGRNDSADAAFVTVVTESFATPPTHWDVDLVTGERRLRLRREVPNHDPEIGRAHV